VRSALVIGAPERIYLRVVLLKVGGILEKPGHLLHLAPNVKQIPKSILNFWIRRQDECS
jgi:hypothetical protein